MIKGGKSMSEKEEKCCCGKIDEKEEKVLKVIEECNYDKSKTRCLDERKR